MSILEIAKECKALNTDYAVTFTHEQLESFANAVIENYKAGLVPVGVVMNRRLFVSPSIDLRNFADDTPLYALKETK